MNKKIMYLISLLIITFLLIQSATATSIFLTSDNIGGENNDQHMLESIKQYIEEYSNGQMTVIIDPQAPSPGEGTRAIESDSDVSVNLAASDPGNFQLLSNYAASSDKQIIFVNIGDYDLEEREFIRRAWDDNYSNTSFAGINNPGKFLNTAGIEYIQPLKQYNDKSSNGLYTRSDDEVNKYIAQQIVQKVNNNQQSKSYASNLIVTHNLNPSVMAQSSSQLVDSQDTEYTSTYNGYTAPQLLYLTSMYLNGNGLTNPSNYENPSSPMTYSLFTKDSYTIYDYMAMAGIVKTYMDENAKAPDYINYDGAYISYYDLTYNFAKITQNHTTSSHMDFEYSYHFDKVHSSIFIDFMPFIVGIIILLILYLAIRRIINKRRNRRRRY